MVELRFFDPNDAREAAKMEAVLDRTERGYLERMRLKPQRRMDAASFVGMTRPWTRRERERYERDVCPAAAAAFAQALQTVVGSEDVRCGPIYLVRSDPSIENAYPFTLGPYVMLPTRPGYSESVGRLQRTLLHELLHVAQRFHKREFDRYYRDSGYVRLSASWVTELQATSERLGYSLVSNPDVYRHQAYGVPLNASGSLILASNLCVDGSGYRELAFIVDRSASRVVRCEWLSDLIPAVSKRPYSPPESSLGLMRLMRTHHYEFHPNEVSSRLFEGLIQ
jgi:hypothetical protein